MEETINLKDILQIIKKRLALIILITAVVTITSAGISYFVLTPIYENSTQILVNQSKNEQQPVQFNEVQTNLQLINTYNVIIKSPAVLDKVISEMNLDMKVKELNGKITVSSEQDSQVVNITVQDEDPQSAAEIANQIASVFQKEVSSIMNVDNVSILSKAVVDPEVGPVEPKPLVNIAIALVAGLMLSIGLVFLIEYLDNSIKTESEIEKLLEIPVLGPVSIISDEHERKGKTRTNVKVRGERYGA
ncbi:Wzz/FepE/Etk N-terminal domain-containing protein [Bacillus gobiensis]|uniref:YveK family protein n=1 Tax=Bacillus gobiensis TaxID=1441095 RepID=UPI003D1A0539